MSSEIFLTISFLVTMAVSMASAGPFRELIGSTVLVAWSSVKSKTLRRLLSLPGTSLIHVCCYAHSRESPAREPVEAVRCPSWWKAMGSNPGFGPGEDGDGVGHSPRGAPTHPPGA